MTQTATGPQEAGPSAPSAHRSAHNRLRKAWSAPRVRAAAPWMLDAAIVWVVFVATFGMLGALGGPEGEYTRIDGVGAWLGFAATLPLIARRPAPLPVLAVIAAASVALVALDYGAVVSLGPAVALYTVARSGSRADRRGALLVGGLTWAAILYAQLAVSDAPRDQFLYDGMLWLAAWFTGQSLRQGAERRATQAERDTLRARDAQREHTLVAAQERERLARDLHDSAGHAINVILVQAGAARLLRERDPHGASRALETIEQVARETIGDIDHLVGALRDDAAPVVPLGVGTIDTLVAQHRASGLAVDARITRGPHPLPPEIDQAAYRIVQEALTNAARHGAGEVELRVNVSQRWLELEAANPVAEAGPPRTGGGRGLAGMRERAELLGGRLEIERLHGRFRVRITLPLDRKASPA